MTCSFHSDFKNMFLKAFQKYVPLVVTNFSKIVSEYLLNIDRTYKSAGKIVIGTPSGIYWKIYLIFVVLGES